MGKQHDIETALGEVRARVARAEAAAARPPGSVRIVAVSKKHPLSAIHRVAACGQLAFGESYLQEAVAKIEATRALGLEWHFIGPLQSNKTRGVAQYFAWVHSVDRLKLAQRLSEQRMPEQPPLNVCIQVNISGETSKSGVTPAALEALATAVARLPRLRLRGLMTIPEPEADPQRQREPFRRLRELLLALNARGLELDTLSMGMSDDLEAAVAEGATLVRIGSAIFGERT